MAEADAVVVAVGAWTPKLLHRFVGRVTPIRSIVAYVEPPKDLAADWAAAPCTMIETRESMLYALPPVADAPLKLAGTANLRQADPDRPESVSPLEAKSVLEAFRLYLPEIERYSIIGTAMGHYADPPDKTFIVERQGCSVHHLWMRWSNVQVRAIVGDGDCGRPRRPSSLDYSRPLEQASGGFQALSMSHLCREERHLIDLYRLHRNDRRTPCIYHLAMDVAGSRRDPA